MGVLQVVRLFGSDGVTIGSQPPPPVLIAADHPPEQRDVVQIGDDEVIPKALGQHAVKDYPKPPSSSQSIFLFSVYTQSRQRFT